MRGSTPRVSLRLQQLETRALPATLLSPTTLTYQDVDGDTVQVSFSKPILTDGNVKGIFHFETGTVDGSNAIPQRLTRIDLSFPGLAAKVRGTDITLTASGPFGGSDGLAHLETIYAEGIDLRDISLDGDLGNIRAGDSVSGTPGVRSLAVNSMGAYGTLPLYSLIMGRVGKFEVVSDVGKGEIAIAGGSAAGIGELFVRGNYNGRLTTEGRIGTATIAGDFHGDWYIAGGAGTVEVLGSIEVGLSPAQIGRVTIEKKVDIVHVGKDMSGNLSLDVAGDVIIDGSVLGAAEEFSGYIDYDRLLRTLRITGDVRGGSGSFTGVISGGESTGSIRISGSLIGGSSAISGQIFSESPVASLEILGDIVGGDAEYSGVVFLTGATRSFNLAGDLVAGTKKKTGWVELGGNAISARIGGDIIGGDVNETGSLTLHGKAKSIRVDGSVRGGAGSATGVVFAGYKIQEMLIGGDIVGGAGSVSGHILLDDKVGSFTVFGDIVGGPNSRSGMIEAFDGFGTFSLGGDLVGSTAVDSGRIEIFGNVNSIRLGGEIVGGTEQAAGSFSLEGNAKSIRIDGDIRGGTGFVAGSVYVNGDVGRMQVYGDVLGSGGTASGLVQIDGEVKGLDIFGNVVGGAGQQSAQVDAWYADRFAIHGSLLGGTAPNSGATFVRKVGTYLIGGDLIGGTGPACGYLQFNESLGSFTVRGSIVGGSAPSTGRVEMYASVKSVSVGGDIIGGTATADGQDLTGSGSIGAQNEIGTFVLGGSLIGADTGGHTIVDAFGSGAMNANWNIGSIQISGDIRGRSELARISAGGVQRPGKAIGSLSVLGRVERADILVGYADFNGWGQLVNPTNGNVRVGSVRVGGDWIASNLCVGVNVTTGLRIPSTGSATTPSGIESIRIGGSVEGTAASGDEFRIAAKQIGSLTVANQAIGPLQKGPSNDDVDLGTNNDFTLKEVL